ncbi:hypothetical protein ARCL110784_10705 [Arcobacter cloacae]|mgnify:CR=1 FL=1
MMIFKKFISSLIFSFFKKRIYKQNKIEFSDRLNKTINKFN